MKFENVGEPVFANVDEALAEKIISRSRENSKATEPDIGAMSAPVTCSGDVNDDPLNFYMPVRPVSFLKITVAVVTLLVLIKLIFGRGSKRND